MIAPLHAGAASTAAPAMAEENAGVNGEGAGHPMRFACPEIVGRDAELSTIAQLIGSAASGSGATLLLSGDPGLGKTALLGRATELARRSGLRVLRAQCERLEMARAFGPFVDALSPLRDHTAAREALALPTPGAVLVEPAGLDRYRTHAAFLRALSALSEERPLLMAVDDLHWADESSLELFAYLSRRLFHAVLLVGTYRREEAATRSALSRALGDLRRDRLWDVPLRALTAADVGRALRLTLGAGCRVSATTREILQAGCGGNPLFLEEMLRALAERGELERTGDTWRLGDIRHVPLPRSTQVAVAERFRVFDEATRRTLMLAAVIGERFPLQVLRRASGLAESDLLVTMRSAVGAQLIAADPSREDTFAFRHPLVREAIQNELLDRDRRAAHLRVARALEGEVDEESVGQLAYHFDAAGERERAFEYHRRAARRADSRRAMPEAALHYSRALELAPDDDRAIAELSMGLSRSRTAGDMQRSVAAIREAIRRYERAGDARQQAHALLMLRTWLVRHLCWPMSQAGEIDRKLADLLTPLGDTPELAFFQASRAYVEVRRGRYDVAFDLARNSVAIAERAGADWELAVGLWHLAETHWATGDLPAAIARLREAVAITSSSPDRGRYRMDLGTNEDLLYLLRHTSGDPEEIRSVAARSSELWERYGVGRNDTHHLHELLRAPDWDGFLRVHEDASTDPDSREAMHLALHRSFVGIARTGPATLEAAHEARTRLLAHEDVTAPGSIGFAEVAIIAGQPELALAALEPAAPFVARPLVFREELVPAASYAVIAANAAADDTAVARWLELAPLSDLRPPLTWCEAVTVTRDHLEAERLWRCGERNRAIAVLGPIIGRSREAQKAIHERRRVPPFLDHLISLRYAELLVARGARGDHSLAAGALADVVSFYRKAGASWYLGRLEQRAEELALPFPRSEGRTAPEPLTRREHEVALLVAKGMTNKEIAERLTLSVRTAESHVERIRAKLGFRTRAQVASWATETYGSPSA